MKKLVQPLLSGLTRGRVQSGITMSRRKLLVLSASAMAVACTSPAPAPSAPVATAAQSDPAPTAAAAPTIAAVAAAVATVAPIVTSSGSRLSTILSAQKLRVGSFLQYKPYQFKNEAGEPDGWDVDVAKAVAAEMGVELEVVDNSWDGIIPALQADKFDIMIASMTNTTKRGLVVNFTTPYILALTGFIHRTADEGKFQTLEAFNDPAITVSVLVQDVSRQTLDRLFPLAQRAEYNSAEEAILAVQTSKADASVASLIFLAEYAAAHPGLSVKPIDVPGVMFPGSMALNTGPENAHLLTFLNLWIQHYFWDALYEPSYKKWFPGQPLPPILKFAAPL